MELASSNDTPNPRPEKGLSSRQLVVILSSVAVGMFAFAIFVLPPMYEVFCEITGLNGKADGLTRRAITSLEQGLPGTIENSANIQAQNATSEHETAESASGPITIQFLADVDKNIPWEFKPLTFSMKLDPNGQRRYRTSYFVKNLTGETISGHAVPSVSPSHMAQYLQKLECFCFTQQTLEGYEEKEMPLVFYLSEDAPDEITTMTLSYMLYRTPDESSDS